MTPSPSQVIAAGLAHQNAGVTLPMSHAGFTVYTSAVCEYADELFAESTRVAKRFSADTVSPKHVDRANEYLLVHRRKSMLKWVGSLGGILLGAAIPIFILPPAGADVIKVLTVAGALGAIGAALVVVGLFGE